jgi:hypothetical protein
VRPSDSLEVRKQLGFGCLKPTRFVVPDGSSVLVQSTSWLSKDKRLTGDESVDSCNRLYDVLYERGGLETLDEADLVALLGPSWRRGG